MSRKAKTEKLPFGSILTSIMREHGHSNRDVARLAGVAAATIQDWRNGTTPADLVAVARLADALHIPMRFLLTGEQDAHGASEQSTVAQVLADGGEVFNGICEVRIRRLVPRVATRGKRG